MPYIAQKVRASAEIRDADGNLQGINATSGRECLWGGANATCYPNTTRVHGYDVYYIPEVRRMLDGSLTDWTPENWISQSTEELSHKFTLYMPKTKRFATIDISLSFDITGRLTLYSADGNAPQFASAEPFQLEMHPEDFALEMFFYLIIAYFMFGELSEIWDCSTPPPSPVPGVAGL